MAPTPQIDRRDLAARYGWALSVINSDPDLLRVFNQAVANTWSPERFVAEIRNTGWFRRHSDTWRQNQVLRQTDPHTWQQRFVANRSTIAAMAASMGVVWSLKSLDAVTANYMSFGMNDAQLKQVLSRFVNFQKGSLTGQAGDLEDQLRQYANSMGVRLSDSYMLAQVRNVAAGTATIQNAKDAIQNIAVTAFPGYERQIKAGQTVEDLASPYKESMARILEINPSTIDAFNPTIRQALMGSTPANKKSSTGTHNSGMETAPPTSMPLWQFEQQLRQDPRWLKTQNAEQALSGVAHKVLTDFGFSA